MAKKLDPQEIEQSRRKKTRADNREERKDAYMTESARIGKAAV